MTARPPLIEIPTSDRTETELQLAYELYVLSKSVNGRYCPTPDYGCSDDDDDGPQADCRRAPRNARLTSNGSKKKKNVRKASHERGRTRH